MSKMSHLFNTIWDLIFLRNSVKVYFRDLDKTSIFQEQRLNQIAGTNEIFNFFFFLTISHVKAVKHVLQQIKFLTDWKIYILNAKRNNLILLQTRLFFNILVNLHLFIYSFLSIYLSVYSFINLFIHSLIHLIYSCHFQSIALFSFVFTTCFNNSYPVRAP